MQSFLEQRFDAQHVNKRVEVKYQSWWWRPRERECNRNVYRFEGACIIQEVICAIQAEGCFVS